MRQDNRQPQPRGKYMFTKDLIPILHGFANVSQPRIDTLEVIEDCMTDYLLNALNKAMQLSARRAKDKLHLEDVMAVLKRDDKKYGRIEELLFMNEELKKIRRVFSTEDDC